MKAQIGWVHFIVINVVCVRSFLHNNKIDERKFPSGIDKRSSAIFNHAEISSPDPNGLDASTYSNKSDFLACVDQRSRTREILGIPILLLPIYIAFLLDAIAVGLAMPILPFFVTDLGGTALTLSLVVSANYICQMLGCIAMGKVSDNYGRRLAATICLLASTLSYFFVSRSTSIIGLALSKMISGITGGLVPIVQASISDVTSTEDRPKYLGRVQALFGLGFVAGPALSTFLRGWSFRSKIALASLFPLAGLFFIIFGFRETKIASQTQSSTVDIAGKLTNVSSKKDQIMTKPVALLVANGFLLMYTFGTQAIYGLFIKDIFGFGERTMSTILAVNGLLVGLFQVLLIKPVISRLGRTNTLTVGNAMLAIGMLGIALVRDVRLHFLLFTLHVIGYSVADTSVASLISAYANPSSQGSALALNQALQAFARVLSPVVAGLLFERSRGFTWLPAGAAPFLFSALFPIAGILVSLAVTSATSTTSTESRKES